MHGGDLGPAEAPRAERALLDRHLVPDLVNPVGGSRVRRVRRIRRRRIRRKDVPERVEVLADRRAAADHVGGIPGQHPSLATGHAERLVAGRHGGRGDVVDLHLEALHATHVVEGQLQVIGAHQIAERVRAVPADGIHAIRIVHEGLRKGRANRRGAVAVVTNGLRRAHGGIAGRALVTDVAVAIGARRADEREGKTPRVHVAGVHAGHPDRVDASRQDVGLAVCHVAVEGHFSRDRELLPLPVARRVLVRVADAVGADHLVGDGRRAAVVLAGRSEIVIGRIARDARRHDGLALVTDLGHALAPDRGALGEGRHDVRGVRVVRVALGAGGRSEVHIAVPNRQERLARRHVQMELPRAVVSRLGGVGKAREEHPRIVRARQGCQERERLGCHAERARRAELEGAPGEGRLIGILHDERESVGPVYRLGRRHRADCQVVPGLVRHAAARLGDSEGFAGIHLGVAVRVCEHLVGHRHRALIPMAGAAGVLGIRVAVEDADVERRGTGGCRQPDHDRVAREGVGTRSARDDQEAAVRFVAGRKADVGVVDDLGAERLRLDQQGEQGHQAEPGVDGSGGEG